MKRISLLLIPATIFLVQCTGNYLAEIHKPEQDLYGGKPLEAAQQLRMQVNTGGSDSLLYMLEAGLMLHYAGEYEKSNSVLLEAAALAEEIPISVSQQGESLLLNDTFTNYRGEDYERVLLHMYLGINFLFMHQADQARVEFKKTNDLLNEIKTVTGRNYKQNQLAKYLTAVAFEIVGDRDNDRHEREFAYIEYKQLNELNPGLQLVRKDLQRLAKKLDDAEDLQRWRGAHGDLLAGDETSGDLVFIFQAGRSAIKMSRGPLLDEYGLGQDIHTAIAMMPLQAGVSAELILLGLKNAENPFPKFQVRSNLIRTVNIGLNGMPFGQTVMLEEISNTAAQNYEDDYANQKAKIAAGVATKMAASIAAGLAAKAIAENADQFGGAFGQYGDVIKQSAGCIGTVVGAGTGAALVSQIKPDLRCWHSLPANLQLARVTLPAGEHTLTLDLVDVYGNIRNSVTEKVVIKQGGKSFLNYRTLY